MILVLLMLVNKYCSDDVVYRILSIQTLLILGD